MSAFKRLHECQGNYDALTEARLDPMKSTTLLIKPYSKLSEVAELKNGERTAAEAVYTADGKFMLEWDFMYDEVTITALDGAMEKGKTLDRVTLENNNIRNDEAVYDYLKESNSEYPSIEAFMKVMTKKGKGVETVGEVDIVVRTVRAANIFSPHVATELPRLRKLPPVDGMSVKDLRNILMNGQYSHLSAKDNRARITDVLNEVAHLLGGNPTIISYDRRSATEATIVYGISTGDHRTCEVNLALG